MNKPKDNCHKHWAQGKKSSMKRRSEENNYLDRGIYLVTLAIERRQPLLGTLAGRADITEGTQAPHVVLTPFGEKVRQEWEGIPRYYPQIEVMKLCIMPDHIHGILFVHEKIERHLGHVINGFKAGTRRAARELGIITEAKPQPTKPTTQEAPAPTVPYAEAEPQPNTQPKSPKHAPVGTLWEPGYHDRLLLHKGQLQHMLAYLDDNPRRLLLKRQHPAFFTQIGGIKVGGLPMDAMGNISLLRNREKRDLQVSTHLYQQEIDALQRDFLHDSAQGKTIISACISRGERQIATACIQAKTPFIVLLVEGFSPLYKPQPLYLEACAEGRLLLLSPFKWQNEKISNMRQRCLYLNQLAKWLSEHPDVEIETK
jgi:REP element-mobilizing transposase RayT